MTWGFFFAFTYEQVITCNYRIVLSIAPTNYCSHFKHFEFWIYFWQFQMMYVCWITGYLNDTSINNVVISPLNSRLGLGTYIPFFTHVKLIAFAEVSLGPW